MFASIRKSGILQQIRPKDIRYKKWLESSKSIVQSFCEVFLTEPIIPLNIPNIADQISADCYTLADIHQSPATVMIEPIACIYKLVLSGAYRENRIDEDTWQHGLQNVLLAHKEVLDIAEYMDG